MANQIINRIQVEGNDVVSFLIGTTPPYQYVRGMSQIMPQTPTYISYRYDSITISQVTGEAFSFTVYTVTDVGGNTFTPLTFQDPANIVQARTIEIYRLLVTSIFKGCCECGNTEPECSIQYTAGNGVDLGTFLYDSGAIRVNYTTANNQDFSGLWPIIQDGSWMFVFSKTDPTVYGIYQLSNYTDGGAYAQFDATLLNGPGTFPDGTALCLDVTSVGGSLVQDWQDTLDISSVLDKDNTVDGAGFNFVFDNNESLTINSAGGSVEVDPAGASLNAGSQQVLVTSGYIDVITPAFASAGTGWVLAKTAAGHVEYIEAGTGTISSIELLMPPAFTVSDPNPLITDGTFTVTVEGTEDQYINGLGELADFPVYTVENGLHPFGGVPGETPADPYLFHLGGELVEDTTITVTNGSNQYFFGVSGLAGQDSQQPFGVSNLGNGGVASFLDYGSGFRPNPSVEVVGDVDLFRPLLELRMEGDLPNPSPILSGRISLLKLTYDGAPANARTAMDFTFKNNDVSPNPILFPAVQLTAEVTNFIANAETANLELMLFQGGSQQVKLIMEGKGQLILNEYGPSGFSDATSNINNALTYVLAVDNTGKVWKKLATGGGTGTVTSIDVNGGTGISVSPAGPITTSGTFTVTNDAPDQIVALNTTGTGLSVSGTYPTFTLQNTAPDQIVSLTPGTNVSITGTYPNFTINASGGGFDVQVNDTTIIPTATLLNLKSGASIDVIDEGGGNVRFDYVGTGSYDSNQGIYNNSGVFELGSPTFAGAPAIAFQSNRYIDLSTKDLTLYSSTSFATTSFIGTGSPYAMIVSSAQSGIQTSASFGYGIDASGIFGGNFGGTTYGVSAGGDQAGVFASSPNNGIIALATGLTGTPIVATSLSTDNSSVLTAIRLTRTCNPSVPVSGIGQAIEFYNSVDSPGGIVQDVANKLVSKFTSVTLATKTSQFEIQGVNNGGSTATQLTLKGTGQLQLNNYTTATSFDPESGPSVGVLNVDNAGNVFVGEGGGGGGTYTVNNGLEPQTAPTSNPNNFQLGGPLVRDTIVTGSSNAYDLTFDEMNEFYVNANSKIALTSASLSNPDLYSQLYAANPSSFIKHQNADFSQSIVIAQGISADLGFSDENGFGSGITATVSSITLSYSNLSISPETYNISIDTDGIKTVTPNVQLGTATAGQVLTLINATTGEVEFQDGGGGGGAAGGGRSYYLNGSVVQGTFGGITSMRQMSPVPISGAGTNFAISTNGYIQSFITNLGDPNKVLIPAGNWNFELWFSASSGGGTPSFYVELSKYDTVGGTFTLVATGSGAPEAITGGTTPDLYFTALSVPQTTLATTDRLAVRVFVNHGGGSRTITLFTEDNRFSQIITSFPSGIQSLNGLTGVAQTFATPGTSGTAPAWTSVGTTHTIDIPLASAASVTAGLISKTEYDTFNGKVGPTRSISTTAPLSGGGNLSADRTLSIPLATSLVDGYLSATDRAAFDAKQAAITGAATTITTSDLTADKALISNASGKVAASSSIVGYRLATLTDPNAITYLRVNADNSVTPRTPAQVLTDLGIAGTIILNRNFADSTPVTGVTTPAIMFTVLIPANTFQTNDWVTSRMFAKTAGVGGTTLNVYVNTSATIPIGGTSIAQWSPAANIGGLFERNWMITSTGVSGTLKFVNNNTAPSYYSPGAFSAASITFNTTIDQYLVFACTNGNIATSTNSNGSLITILR